jgi:hypothetical protein
MLVLSRKKFQKIHVDVPPSDKYTRVTVTLCAIVDGYKARIGFDVEPQSRDVVIWRDDLGSKEKKECDMPTTENNGGN